MAPSYRSRFGGRFEYRLEHVASLVLPKVQPSGDLVDAHSAAISSSDSAGYTCASSDHTSVVSSFE